MSKRKKNKPYPVEPAAPAKSEVAAPAEAIAVNVSFGCPDISVVIPIRNAENFIGACLESILAQTFKNFEVIVVDDCSTDNSAAIVESYAEKFGGRLIHFRLKKFSGGAGIPRNTGIALARGEYIRFIDATDKITATALEEDFRLAKEYDAEVVYHTLFYNLNADGSERLLGINKYQSGDEIVLDEDLSTRVQDFARNNYYHASWCSFSRRDFLIANELYFPNVSFYDDVVWSYALLIYAKRFLRVPSAIYFYRAAEDSTSSKVNSITASLKSLDAFLSRHEFFETAPQLHYALLENYLNERLTLIFKDNLPPFSLYETLKEEFGESLGEYNVLIPALFAALAQQQKIAAVNLAQFKEIILQSEQRIAELENQIKQIKTKE